MSALFLLLSLVVVVVVVQVEVVHYVALVFAVAVLLHGL